MTDHDVAAFIKEHAQPAPVQFVPEMQLYQAGDADALWRAVAAFTGEATPPFPFWAYVWAGGQGLARYILDNPEEVRGKRVLDFACGGGVVAIAAAKAGAKEVLACDIDSFAQEALGLNSALADMAIRIKDVDIAKPFCGADIILAGDVCYEHTMSHRVMKFLRLCKDEGIRVLIGDPGRGYAPERTADANLTALARYGEVPVSRAIEQGAVRAVTVWEVGGRLSSHRIETKRTVTPA